MTGETKPPPYVPPNGRTIVAAPDETRLGDTAIYITRSGDRRLHVETVEIGPTGYEYARDVFDAMSILEIRAWLRGAVWRRAEHWLALPPADFRP